MSETDNSFNQTLCFTHSGLVLDSTSSPVKELVLHRGVLEVAKDEDIRLIHEDLKSSFKYPLRFHATHQVH